VGSSSTTTRPLLIRRSMKARIFILLYGKDHAQLHARILNSVHRYAPLDVPISLHGNLIPEETIELGSSIVRARGAFSVLRTSEVNIPKYTVMRSFFTAESAYDNEWVVWFDDDSHVVSPDWWKVTCEYIEARRPENICYVGQPWFVHHLPGQEDFIRASHWYKGKPFDIIKGKPGVHFAQGGYWWLRTDVLRVLDWPDVRLSCNGGDTLLGEAIRQSGRPFHKFHYGVKINDAKRRGLSERPAGSTVDVRR
jgi:hypothetical protein